MALKEPSYASEITHSDTNNHPLLPYIFRGRDFNSANDIFLSKLLEFHETFYRAPDINNTSTNTNKADVCACPGFIKCQHIIVHYLSIMTSEFAQQTWLEIISNDNKLNMHLKRSSIHVGNTSNTKGPQDIMDDSAHAI